MNKLPPLSEDQEQIAFIGYLEAKGLTFTAIPNHTYNPHHSQQAKNRRLGLRKGLPDVLVALPGIGLVFIEMKRTRLSTTSPEQRTWIEVLNKCPGTEAHICKGCDEAIAVIEELLALKSPSLPPATDTGLF